PDGKRSRSSARASALALFAQLPDSLLAIDRFHPTALEIVVAVVEHLPDRGHLFQVPGKGILNDVFGGTSAGRGEIVQFLGRFGRDMHFHGPTVRLRRLTDRQAPGPVYCATDDWTGLAPRHYPPADAPHHR